MVRAAWGLVLPLGLFLLCASAEPPPPPPPPPLGHGGFRRLYVLQPAPGPGPVAVAGAVAGPGSAAAAAAAERGGGLRVSSISTRHGASGQPHTYNVELSASYGGQVRTRRMGSQAAAAAAAAGAPIPLQAPVPVQVPAQQEQKQMSGVNVCGGQCCHGWSKAQGSQRCTKPNCIPQCQNGGMCLRPQLCVCKPGSNGKACEQKTAPAQPFPAGPGNGHNLPPQRPIPQQVAPGGHASAPPPANGVAHMKLTVKAAPQLLRPHYIQQHIQQQIRSGQSSQYVIKPKYYHTHSGSHTQTQAERPLPLGAGHAPLQVGNHTGRIKVVFTPTICKLTCIGGRCHNNCELGNTTTIISENGRAADTLTAPNFRVVVCHLPCMNGGKCSARDKCQCPPNFTGKFCQMALQPGGHQQQQQQQQTPGSFSQTQVHSTHSLPLTYSNGQGSVFSPNIVNIHIKHPPEASVQVHQVSQLDNYHNNGQQLKASQSASSSSSSSSSYSYHHTQSSHKVQHHGYNVVHPGHAYQLPPYQPIPASSKNTLGRCFQETAGSQCGKALPGLTKQEQCCGTMGTSWGFHKCQKCPKKPSLPLIDCPPGYSRVNGSQCQDLDECQLQGACPNGNCVNTLGSYRCMCKAGFVPDPTLTACTPDSPAAVPQEKGACFRLVSSGRQCLHPVSAQLSKQLCCCSVGKAWGPHCDRCPPPGTAKFKEICPGGMGYTVLPNPPANKPVVVQQRPVDPVPPQPLPTLERTVEAFGTPDQPRPVATAPPEQELTVGVASGRPATRPVLPQLSPGLATVKMEAAFPEVVERSSPPAPVEILPSKASQDIAPTQSAEVDECQISPYICGPGVCYNTLEGYTCHCEEGYQLDHSRTTCTDIDECEERPWLCLGGQCRNAEGSFLCVCPGGFQLEEGSVCVDIDECQDPRVCTRGHCVNTQGSFRCDCGRGFRESPAGDQCDDVDECAEEQSPCGAVGECVNNVGSFTCSCPQGFTAQLNATGCKDVDECMEDPDLCAPHGECRNTEGSYMCVCDSGFTATLDTPSCEDIDECGLSETVCGPHGLCENRLGSFRCLCDQGYQEVQGGQDGAACQDVNECELLSSVCGEAQCVNVEGSFLCVCPGGQDYNVMNAKCEPTPTASSVERKECYFRLSDENLCESVLTTQVTLQECCCTLGAGWGDNCEVHPCPVNGTDQFDQMCPSGRGSIPSADLQYGVATADSYRDADECSLFGEEVCKGGFCLDTLGSYECYCKTGQDYDPAKMECRDINECLEESVCEGGECVNTDGSFQCFCPAPTVLEPSSNRCVLLPEPAEQHESEQMDFQGICWQKVTDSVTCTQPLGADRKTTYTECCCLYGEAWGMDCALCPPTHTADYAVMCNLPVGGERRPYGHDALVAGPVHHYPLGPDLSEEHDQDQDHDHDQDQDQDQDHHQPPFFHQDRRPAEAFEGLRAEECGILDGCENGRCVRVQEGYTCDCFDGYTLDLSRMACVDVDECSELNSRMSLCGNARCVNTAGSYRCLCLPGFTASHRPNYCVEAHTPTPNTHAQPLPPQ